jgi:hypothetical protein
MKGKFQEQHREYILGWCDDIFSQWLRMKPNFYTMFDIKTLDEWEEDLIELKEKLQLDLIVDSVNFQKARSLYQQWEQFNNESHAYRKYK